jgi:TonB family protein
VPFGAGEMTSRRGLAATVMSLVLVVGSEGSPTSARHSKKAYSHRVAVLALGDVSGLRSEVARVLSSAGLTVVATSLADAAARGVGYGGSLNPTREEVRRLAAAIGCEVVVLGASSVVERETADPDLRWDAFAGLFLVDGRSGVLLRYQGWQVFGSGRDRAVLQLFSGMSLDVATWPSRLPETGSESGADIANSEAGVYLDFVTQPEGRADVVPPRFFFRPVPKYTKDADRVHANATVELIVEFNADGSYGRIDVERWAGFGLDEAAILAVRSSKFWPARRGGIAMRSRAMLRFNFRFRGDEPLSPVAAIEDRLVAEPPRESDSNPQRSLEIDVADGQPLTKNHH